MNDEFNLIKDNENEINTNTNEIKNEINQQVDMEEVRNYLNKKMFSKNYHHLTLELYLNILNSIDSNKAKDLPLNRNIINNNLYNNIHPIEKQIDLPNKPKHFYQNLDKFIKLGKLKIFKSEAKYTKEKTIKQITQTNQKLQSEFELLQVEIQEKLDKMEYKEKNDIFENEKKKRYAPLEQLLKVKEKEIQNSIEIVKNYKKEKKN